MELKTFEATLYAPLFYSSSEGRTVKTRKLLSATALTHALGYRYSNLEKRYVLTEEDTTCADYSYLCDLPIYVSDMSPVQVKANERTFRSTDYRSERQITTNEKNIAGNINSKKAVPEILETSGAGWQTIRNYVGIAPGSKYEFAVWTNVEIPDNPSFNMGIKQTGEFRAMETNISSVVLNKYLLDKVYDVKKTLLTELAQKSTKFKRGNDPRLQHFIGVPIDLANDIAQEVIN